MFYVLGGTTVNFTVKLSTSGSVQMGYINNSGIKTRTYSGIGSSHSTSFTIPFTGYYRFYVTNQSSGTLQITGGTISFFFFFILLIIEAFMRKIIFKVIKWILLVLILILAVIVVWNYACKRNEAGKVKDAYGQSVEVAGKNMVVDIKGEENETTIILLPGWGSPSPVLEFLPLAEQLSKEYRAITIEPFGYGLSDVADTERNIDTIVEELHECVKELDYNQYYLMAHSLSGLYSLYWANVYPQEVQGFIGIDPSVPKQSDEEPFPISMIALNKLSAYWQKVKNITGITRLQSVAHSEKAIYADLSYGYSEKQLEVYRILSMDYMYNKDVMNELKHMEETLETVRDMKFPEDLPVLQFISSSNCEIMDLWEPLHKEVITETGRSEVIRLDGGHYLHFERRQEIVEKVNEWILN